MSRLALELSKIKESQPEIIFKIQSQARDLRHIVWKKTGNSGLIEIGSWTFRFEGCPELRSREKVFFLRGNDRSLDNHYLCCPRSYWNSLQKAVEELNKFVGPLYEFEDEFFAITESS